MIPTTVQCICDLAAIKIQSRFPIRGMNARFFEKLKAGQLR